MDQHSTRDDTFTPVEPLLDDVIAPSYLTRLLAGLRCVRYVVWSLFCPCADRRGWKPYARPGGTASSANSGITKVGHVVEDASPSSA